MARKGTPGLRKRGGIWHIQKRIKGYGRLHETTGTSDRAEAERYMTHRLEEIRRIQVYGERPSVTFREAAKKFLAENDHLKSLERIGHAFDTVMSYIGDLPLEQVHDGSLAKFKEDRLGAGIAAGTMNRDLGCIRRVLKLAAGRWRHPNGMTYLSSPPLIEMVKGKARKPYPLIWEEQTRLLAELPSHLERMALFMVNTGLRKSELCGLRWEWEVEVPELETSVFVLPEDVTKNGEERVVVLNRIARSVLESQRGQHPEYVFTYKGQPLKRMLNSAWRRARTKAKLPKVRVHDLRHTFGQRLRNAGVSFEDRQDLLGHKSERITTHYSAPELAKLLEAADFICEKKRGTVLRVVEAKRGQKRGQKATLADGAATC